MLEPGIENKVNLLVNWLITVFFFIGISLPGMRLLCTAPAKEISEAENRQLMPLPAWHWDKLSIEAYPSAYERYFNDHFGCRDRLIRWHHYLKAIIFHVSPVEKVLIGREGWLYFTEHDMVKDFLGQVPYNEQELLGIKDNLQARQEILARLGMKYLLVIAPDKHSIYPEYLPDYLLQQRGETRLDQLVSYLRRTSTVNLLDLRGVLLEEKFRLGNESLLYLIKDTHWNQRGAFVAYRAIMAAIRSWSPETVGLTDSDLVMETKLSTRGDLANMLDLNELLPEQAPYLRVKVARSQRDDTHGQFFGSFASRYKESYRVPFMTKGGNSPLRVVVFRDSFFTDIAPFFSESFEHVTYIYEAYNEQIMVQLLGQRLKPDLVVEEIIERYL